MASVPAAPPTRSRAATLARWSGWAVGAGILTLAVLYLYTGALAVVNFAWPYPAFDQFRLYPIYLELSFPDNLLQRENGHRPIFPGLIRYAEILWFQADQSLQIWLGLSAALLTSIVIGGSSLRAAQLPFYARAAGASAAFIGVFWLGNARMLLHGNELIHAYTLTLCVVLGAVCVWRASHANAMVWMSAASVLATIATFCFGPGMACFPAFAIAAFVSGVRRRAIAIPIAWLVACLVLYLAVLPGDSSVRESLTFRPWDNLNTAARWLSAPFMTAWLGFADPPLSAHSAGILAQRHGWLVDSAQWVQDLSGLPWATWQASLLGFFGLSILGVWLVRAIARRERMTLVETISGSLMMFGAASALIIGIGRLGYFDAHPNQIFADRYLIWPCLFWVGVVLSLLQTTGSSGRFIRPAVLAGVLGACVVIWPTHQMGAGWGATIYRLNLRGAAAAQSDVIGESDFSKNDPAAPFDDKIRSLRLFRERGLAMFARPESRMLGQAWTGPLANATPARHLTRPQPIVDYRGGTPGIAFSGVLAEDGAQTPKPFLLVLDDRNIVRGYGAFSSTGSLQSSLRMSLATMRGFDAVINAYDPTRTYRLVNAREGLADGTVVASIPPLSEAPP